MRALLLAACLLAIQATAEAQSGTVYLMPPVARGDTVIVDSELEVSHPTSAGQVTFDYNSNAVTFLRAYDLAYGSPLVNPNPTMSGGACVRHAGTDKSVLVQCWGHPNSKGGRFAYIRLVFLRGASCGPLYVNHGWHCPEGYSPTHISLDWPSGGYWTIGFEHGLTAVDPVWIGTGCTTDVFEGRSTWGIVKGLYR